jgi:signal transduction histidine kinase
MVFGRNNGPPVRSYNNRRRFNTARLYRQHEYRQLAEANRMKSRFLSTISHELGHH